MSRERRPLGVIARNFGKLSETCVYRQVVSLSSLRPFVACLDRANAERLPYEPVHVLSPSLPAWFFLGVLRRSLPERYRSGGGFERLKRSLRVEKPLLRLLRRYGAEVLLVHFGWTAVSVLRVLLQTGLPYVLFLHGTDVNQAHAEPESEYAQQLRVALENAERCLFVSDFLRARGVELGAPVQRSETFYLGVPLSERTASPTDRVDTRFISVGRMVPVKGHDVLLEAFASVLKHSPGSTLTLVGDGECRSELEHLASELGIAEKVTFTGTIANAEVYQRFLDSDVFVQPSRRLPDQEEGLPIAMQEAMAVGLPVVATRTGGIPECAIDGETAILVEPEAAGQLAEAMLDLAGHPALRAELGRQARRRITERFNVERQSARLRDMLADLIAGMSASGQSARRFAVGHRGGCRGD